MGRNKTVEPYHAQSPTREFAAGERTHGSKAHDGDIVRGIHVSERDLKNKIVKQRPEWPYLPIQNLIPSELPRIQVNFIRVSIRESVQVAHSNPYESTSSSDA